MAYIGMARHSTSAFNECSTTRMLAERLESSGKIKTFLRRMIELQIMMVQWSWLVMRVFRQSSSLFKLRKQRI